MRRAWAIVRNPAVWLAVLLFLAWTWFFHRQVTPPPQFVVATDAKHEPPPMVFRASSTWATIQHVSDNGTQVTIGIHRGGFHCDTRLEVWDARTGTDQTPALWRDRVWSTPSVRFGAPGDRIFWDLEPPWRPAGFVFPGDHSKADSSQDGRFTFAKYSIPGGSSVPYLTWQDTATRERVGLIANAPHQALIDSGRALVTHPWREVEQGDRESYRLHFWDTATGAHVGEWDLGARSDKGGSIDDLIGSENGRYLAGTYSSGDGVERSPARRINDRLTRAVGDDPPDWRYQILLWDVIDRRELARLPGRSAAFSRDGSWLATIDHLGILRVWEVPVRRPWGRILGYASVASLGCLALLLAVARVGRRVGGTRPGRGLRRTAACLWAGRVRWWATGFLGLLLLTVGGLAWYSMAVTAAREQMETAYEQIGDGVTEADVTALVGRPPDDGPVEPAWGRGLRGGGQGGTPATVRKWTRLGTEMVVHFGEDGTAKASFMSDPVRGVLERAVDWLGW